MKEIQAVREPAHYHAEAHEGMAVMIRGKGVLLTGEKETLGGEVRWSWEKTWLRI